MHLVTKILIVFGALLSVLLAGLTMAYTFNAQAIRDSVDREKAYVAAATADLNNERTKYGQDLAAARLANEQLSKQLEAATSDFQRLSGQHSTLTNEREEAKLEAARAQADSRGKDERLALQTSLVAALQAEASEARKAQLDMAKRETELMTRLNELESSNQVLTQNVKALQEQLAEQKLAASKMTAAPRSGSESTFVSGPTLGGFEVSSGALVTARVRKTVRAESGDDLAFISAGSSSGLKVGQKLSIVRDGRFLAALILTAVDSSEAAGRIDRLGRSVDIMADDLVLSRVN